MITIHGRTRCQFYKGRADWAAIRAVKEGGADPRHANGEITDAESAAEGVAPVRGRWRDGRTRGARGAPGRWAGDRCGAPWLPRAAGSPRAPR